MNNPNPTRTLRALAEGSSAVLVAGAPDALSARLLQRIGFDALYVSGAGLANLQYGVPDLGLVTASEMADQIERLRSAVDVPLIVDADTGFGSPLNVARTVRSFERRGADGIQIEDQTFPKRCGHFDGKSVVSQAEMVARIHAAVDARHNPDVVLIARTDARATHGLAEALERAAAYHEAGADVLFVEAPQSAAEIEQIAAELPGPLLINLVEGGKTPQLNRDRLEQVGYRFVLYANSAMRAALLGMKEVMQRLLADGTSELVVDRMLEWSERQDLAGKPAYDALERRYAPISDAAAAPDRRSPEGTSR